ncbi:MAG TPA: pyruvate:ferredoxin (flavodoxin) oxidoreductase [Acidimicrobiales bacterium]|nr:pyruvate:ferredoxin (flavodoxin) oxidoreductase [Acidimicrobiales bacterium]
MSRIATVDGNEAAADAAYRLSEVIAIYPITPASTMGELSDTWSGRARPNLWGDVPEVIEMQSEGGAAGALHGALQTGALATTFTASQGLLLMLPNMFKIAGELTSAVIHVAARAIATHALSIFGDHSDVMAARTTGFAMLCASSVQEAHDLSVIAHLATLEARVPILHFFDGFRTSSEINVVSLLDDEELRSLVDEDAIRAHRDRALSPEHPVLRGSAQNPDTFFQAREASNLYYDAMPAIVQKWMDRFAAVTGRQYHLFDYSGHPEAERVVVLMGSGSGAAREAADDLVARGERVGVLTVRLFRPFDAVALAHALPPTVTRIAVLDRTKEPGALGEPLFQDIVTALAEERPATMPQVIGGRYGLASKEFTPAMVHAVFAALTDPAPRRRFTVGIVDDVSHLSLPWDRSASTEPDDVLRAVFYGLGSDGTVGANKNTVKIVSNATGRHGQGYFVYDSKKSGSMTVSHVRFSPRPIEATYLISQAQFVACHQFSLLERNDVLALAAPGATFLVNSPYGVDQTWDRLPAEVQAAILDKGLEVYAIDAYKVSREAGLDGIVSTALQTAFFELSKLLPREQAREEIKAAIRKTYGKLGDAVLEPNFRAVDAAFDAVTRLDTAGKTVTGRPRPPAVPADAPDVVQRVTARMLEGQGDLLPVSAFAADGTFTTGTAKYERRSIALEIPEWDPELCIDCGKCSLVCPHAAIRTTVAEPESLLDAPSKFQSKPAKEKAFSGFRYIVQVAPDDCTGCGICVEVCPVRSKEAANHKAIDMVPKDEILDTARDNWEYYQSLPKVDPTKIPATVRGTQLREPLFEFSGACAGCGETPYLKLLTQLFGDHVIVANATGCSSIYGGNLPTTPWSAGADGRGPAWSNSLFEDNAEFGLGMRLALDQRRAAAERLLRAHAGRVGDDLVDALLTADQSDDAGLAAQRERVAALKRSLASLNGGADPSTKDLVTLADDLIDNAVWIVGGDGWAYDIGFGGLDHVLASGRNVNVLVLDTEGYSNTGGQASKSTARGAVAKFASAGKSTRKKDLGMLAAGYGSVYVAQIAAGAHDLQTVRAFTEAASFPGPSLVLAYSHCIAHGIDMEQGMAHQKAAVQSGYWPLYRFDPRHALRGDHPLRLDSKAPTIPFEDFAKQEARFSVLSRVNPAAAEHLFRLAQHDIDERWHFYEQLGEIERWSDEEVD